MEPIDPIGGWQPLVGASGLWFKLLHGSLDETANLGTRSRLVRFGAGGATDKPFTHAYWEEAFLMEGDLVESESNTLYRAPAYVVRPPGTPHGPFRSENGCLLLEVHYYKLRDRHVGR